MTKCTAIAMAALMAVGSVTPVQAQEALSFGQRQQVVQSYCDRHPNDYDCRGYFDGRWSNQDYDWFYYNNRRDLEPFVAAIFGLAIGAIIGGAIANSNKNNDRPGGNQGVVRPDAGHVARCQARYKSYDVRTDTFLGYDGIRHPCNL